MEILNERPAEMDYDTYRKIRNQQKKNIKQYLKGGLVWLAIDMARINPSRSHGNYTPAKAAELKRRNIPFV